MSASRFAQGVAVARDNATPVTAVPVTAVPDRDPGWYGPEHWGGWDGGPVPPPRPPEWHGPPEPQWSPIRRGRRWLAWVAGGAAVVGLAGAASVAGVVLLAGARAQPPAPRATGGAQPGAAAPARPGATTDEPTGAASAGGSAAPAAPLDTAAIVQSVNRSVVNITSDLGLRNSRAAGTGVVLSATGLVLTNNHVIAGATSISGVAVANGRTFQASVVGYDRSHDIAVIQLAGAAGLPRLSLADSSRVKVGDPIVAVGNAGGAGGTPAAVTGQVTGLNRVVNAQDPDGGGSRRLEGLIEVAADIRPGDSGGPLVDRTGKLIGINTAALIDERNQSAGGTGFAIPSNAAIGIAQQIQAGEASSTIHIGPTALLGVSTADAQGAGGGVAVTGVISGSPAERAGLTTGDVIRSVDGQAVGSASALTTVLDTRHPGDVVRLAVVDRAGRQRIATVRLATGPAG
ncbi:S1C family serine protease [Dactylosporangium sp. CA-092794]|uniref:S1C family serine protease n=1 Tax=Dactylosporangium sp. CA-092794 TaxID=3239929 RepID=UPI003D90A1F0